MTEGLDEKMLYAEDMDIIYKLEEVTIPIFIDRELYKYRMVPNSITNTVRSREIGAQNWLRSKRCALIRRKIIGFEKVYYSMIFIFEHILHSDKYSILLKKISWKLKQLFKLLDNVLKIRKGSILNR